MTVAPAAWLVASAAGVLTATIVLVRLRRARRGPSIGAALARGLAVALAAFAAFAPVLRTSERTPGKTLVAAPTRAQAPGADRVVHWPDDVPDAASAVETLRASRDSEAPANLVLAVGTEIGRGRDVAPVADALRRGDAAVESFVVALPTPNPPTPLRPAPRILAPAGAVDGVPAELTLDAGDAPFDAGTARIEIDGRATDVPLAAGAARVATPPLALSAGTHLAVAEIPGRLPAATIVHVAGPPRVLFVSVDAATRGAASMLRAQGLDVAEVRESDLSDEDVARCAAIVLGPGATGGARAAAVAARVRGGAGLLALGGEGTRGLERFKDGALDALLPVVPPAPAPPKPAPPAPPPPVKKPDPAKPKSALDEGDKIALRVALLLVIDTSGSMSIGGKLEMAQQSAIAAARALSPSDRVAVISFDDEAHVVAPFQDAGEMDSLYRRIAALQAGGQTNFFPALRIGYRDILAQPCGIRHVVLLTDGETQPAAFRGLVEDGVEKKVTLSTVAIGSDADRHLLALLAGWGRGQMYVADDAARLPEIVTLDTRRFTTSKRDERKRPKTDVEDLPQPPPDAPPVAKEKPAEPAPRPEPPPARRPHVVSAAAFLAGVETVEWPALPHAESPAARPVAQVVLAWDDASPALTLGRAGLGRVAVVSADAASDEARDFLRWDAAPRVLAQLVRGLVEPPSEGAPPVEARFVEGDDGRAFVRVDVPGGGALGLDPIRAGASLSVRLEDRGAFSIGTLAATPPAGVFVGTFAPPGATVRRATAVSAGPRAPASDLARRIADASGAKLVGNPPPPRDGPEKTRDEPIEWPLLVGAAALLLVEAAFRRFARAEA